MSNSQESEGVLSPFLGKKRYKYASRYIKQDDIVLDFGCGAGGLKRYLPKSVVYYGIDSQKQWTGNKNYLHKVKISESLPKELKYKQFTVVSALAIIEHLKDPAELFEKAADILSEGGRLVLTTPHPSGEKVHTAGALLGLFSKHAHDEHEALLNKKDLTEIASKYNFTMVRYQRFLFGMNQVAVFVKE